MAAAGEALEESVRRDPGNAGAWEALSRARLRAVRVPEALEAASRATGLAPGRREYSRTLAEALLASERGADALRVLKEGLGSPPVEPVQARAYAAAHWRLARREVSSDHRGRARRLLRAGLQVDPSHGASRDLLAWLDADFAAERPRFEALVRAVPGGDLDPNDVVVYAAWLCRWGEFEEAWPWWKALLDQPGSAAAVHYQVGKEHWEGRGTLEGYESAVVCYRDALARDPGYAEARNRLWQCLLAVGRTAEAREEAAKFFEAAPCHPDAYDAEALLEPGGAGR